MKDLAAPRSSSNSDVVTRPWRGISAAVRVAERRQRLLDAGLELFGTQGIAGVGVGDVCAEAGLTKRYFYENFESIDQLIDAVVNAILDHLTELVVPAIIAGGPLNPRPALVALMEGVLADPRLVRMLAVETRTGGLTTYRDRLITRAVETWLATLHRDDSPRARSQRTLLAYAFAGSMSELAIAWIDGRLDIPLDELIDWAFKFYEHLLGFSATMAQTASPGGAGEPLRVDFTSLVERAQRYADEGSPPS